MANKGQQPAPYLQMSPITASQFLHIWNHFDSDGRKVLSPDELVLVLVLVLTMFDILSGFIVCSWKEIMKI